MFKQILLAALMTFGLFTQASAAAKGPYELVADTTQELVKVIEEARSYVDKDPERFTNEVRRIMDDVVDFQSFARGIMGKYGSRGYYESLKTDAERAQFRERVIRFTDSFKDGLINTYSKGLLGFNGNRIEVLPLEDDVDLSGNVGVRQDIYGERAKPYQLVYSVRKDANGMWKLRNVIIEGVNLGRIFSSQFNAALKQYDGDVDKVIDNWIVVPKEVMEKAAE